MSSKMRQRSALSLIEYLNLIQWQPKNILMAGVGTHHEEADAFKLAWSDVKIVGYEPNPMSFEGMKNTFPGVLVKAALSNTVGKSKLYFRKTWKNGSSLFKPNFDSHETEVYLEMLDGMCCPEDCLLWLDTEGSELNILKGGGRFLTGVKAINIEMTGVPRGEGWSSPLETHRYLSAYGFVQAHIHTIRPVIGQYDTVYLQKELFKPEFCCCLDSLGFN